MAQEQRRGSLILDTRPAEQFASFHITGSMQLGLMGPFASWAAILIEPGEELLLVADSPAAAEEARNRLARVGIRHVRGFALADKSLWQNDGLSIASLTTQGSEEVFRELHGGRPLQLVDVRSQAEWLKGHLPGATSMPLHELRSVAAAIDFSRPSLLYCQAGYRASTAASILLRDHAAKGSVMEISIMVDGIEGWHASGLPLETPLLVL
jgi:rhodanese-related sulfurtransferase